jgi:hypothetical protein
MEVESSIGTSGNQSIQGNSRKGKGISGSGERKGSGIRKRLVHCNKDSNCAGNECPLSVNDYLCVSQFSIQSSKIKESSMKIKHLVVKCSLEIDGKIIETHALIYCGATTIAIIHKDFVHHQQLKEQDARDSLELEVIDGRPIESGSITTLAKIHLAI